MLSQKVSRTLEIVRSRSRMGVATNLKVGGGGGGGIEITIIQEFIRYNWLASAAIVSITKLRSVTK